MKITLHRSLSYRFKINPNPRPLCSKSVQDLVSYYDNFPKQTSESRKLKLNPHGVFTNTELRLSNMEAIGFDYDYTLASYNACLDETIFKRIIRELVESRHYPRAILDLEYNPNFLRRGIHYDVNRGIFMKIDSYNRIQMDSVYRGFVPVSEEEAKSYYPGCRLLVGRAGQVLSENVKQIVDIFQIPQLYAWAAVLEYLESSTRYGSTKVQPLIVFEDIDRITYDLHIQGELHKEITKNIDKYLEPNTKLGEMLELFARQRKKLFILTNSPYNFINVGMSHMISRDWRDLFDVIICLSRKPKFFAGTNRVFRRLSSKNFPTFGEVQELRKGEIYSEGNIALLHKLTGWEPNRILYFGDQMFADLAEPILTQGWHTGAIIRELEGELERLNSREYITLMDRMHHLNYLIYHMQGHLPDTTALAYTDRWCVERKQIRQDLKDMINPYFGSIFRTHLMPTQFYRRLSRFAEIYTSCLTNLAHYNTEHHRFLPVRTKLSHEVTYDEYKDVRSS